MLNYHTTPQISAGQHYSSHITALGGYSLWGDSFRWSFRNPDSSHPVPSPFPKTSSPSVSISRRGQEYVEMHMEAYNKPALEGYRFSAAALATISFCGHKRDWEVFQLCTKKGGGFSWTINSIIISPRNNKNERNPLRKVH